MIMEQNTSFFISFLKHLTAKKVIVIFSLILFFAAILTTVLYVGVKNSTTGFLRTYNLPSPTVGAVTQWKSYENQKFNFSFKYPRLQLPYVKSDEETEFDMHINMSPSDPNKEIPSYNIYVNADKTNKSLIEYLNLDINKKYYAKAKKVEVVLAGQPGFQFYREIKSGEEASIISSYTSYIKNGDYIYRITLSSSNLSILQAQKSTYDMILSTFTLLNQPENNQVVCAQDAKQCPDGSYVSRHGPTCDFDPCSSSATGKTCGGITGETGPSACPIGYYCKYVNNYPDAQGTCTKR